MPEAVIVSAVRTAVGRGKKDGSLAGVTPIDLSALVIQEAVKRADIDPRTIDDVLWGCAMPEGSQGLNVARLAVLRARLPVEVPAATINRFCSSGLQTIASGAQAILSGMADVVVAGGVEMMSQVPMSGHHARLHDGMTEGMIAMGFTAERVATRWKVSRADQDAYALGSHQKAAAALEAGAFTDQVVPVPVERVTWHGATKQVEEGLFAVDELVRKDTTAERLAKLPAAFKAG
ncbi:MAG: thiolase family protein, partial [Gemmatimonadetes bacterium]|nr:thiolase family protein [Gemmatimonadota bacterium]